MSGAWRCLFWVQSLLGSGHLRRAQLLADAFAARGAAVTLVNGGPPGPWPTAAGVRTLQLPWITTRGVDFGDLIDAAGDGVSAALWDERRRALLAALDSERPDVIVTEMFPFGRRAFRGELLPMLEAARAMRPRPLAVASVRDVLVSKPDPARYGWMVETCLAHYDRVLVHGDERLIPFAASFPPVAALGDRVIHTGFVHPGLPPAAPPAEAPPDVLVSAGGGAVGERLLRTAIAARPMTLFADARWLLVGGQNLPAGMLTTLAALLPDGCTLARYRADLATLMGQCAVSVSQAGYNSVVEGLATGARMVLIPFAAAGEDEQQQRATRLAALGVAEQIDERDLTPQNLTAAIDRIAGKARPAPADWAFDGAARSADIVASLVVERAGDA